jgi:predicted transcriptional regulator
MLEAAREDMHGVIETKIIYSGGLSFTQSKEYLKLVLERGLLEYQVSSNRYRLTRKGVEYLEMFQHTRALTEI